MKARIPTLLALGAPLLGLALPFAASDPASPLAQSGQRGGSDAPQTGDTTKGDDPKPDKDAETPAKGAVDIFGRPVNQSGNTFADKLRGGWKLTRLMLPDSDPRGRIAQGFLHVGDGFLSMELHASWTRQGELSEYAENDLHTTFTAEYELVGNSLLRCATRIGSYLDEETGGLSWEREGYQREYRVGIEGRELTLEFGAPGQAPGELVFEASPPTKGGARDIYGRKRLTTGAFGDKDIFGRPQAVKRGESDIFGREKPKPEGENEEETKTPKPVGGGGR